MFKIEKIFVINLLICLASAIAFAQGNPNEGLSLEEAQKLGKLPKEFQIDRMRRPPAGCPKNAKAYIINRDSTTGIQRSDNLNNFFRGFPREFQTQFPPRGYGEKGPNRYFADSFPLGSCKICAASLSAQVVNEGAANDSLNVYLSDPTLAINMTGNGSIVGNRLSYLLSYGSGVTAPNPALWASATTASPNNIGYDLDLTGNVSNSPTPGGINKINQYIFGTTQNAYLDVIVQDDTQVNSMQVIIWR